MVFLAFRRSRGLPFGRFWDPWLVSSEKVSGSVDFFAISFILEEGAKRAQLQPPAFFNHCFFLKRSPSILPSKVVNLVRAGFPVLSPALTSARLPSFVALTLVGTYKFTSRSYASQRSDEVFPKVSASARVH